ncbi:hypothetical protein GCM10011514_44790 [Emticicia aquatilis]|uniref:Uncharacterized protein n=1 Tax=Emticicia aquatilis TaxID=1537369 RepID=A0A916Z5Q8_9BACT|nr:hypothetical protein GCM10011514_44790 [Emticicia aquatilis]
MNKCLLFICNVLDWFELYSVSLAIVAVLFPYIYNIVLYDKPVGRDWLRYVSRNV